MKSGRRYKQWICQSGQVPTTYEELRQVICQSRHFEAVAKLNYGDYGLHDVLDVISEAIENNRRIALYADYDVDGTMSCVSWIWFLQAIGYENFIHYIPCRFKEGYGVNLSAIQHLVTNEGAEVVITMDTGITANEEAKWCRDRGVVFICTDHHKIQPEKMPDCLILNPKLHPEPIYQELCGCGITFVLLRKLAQHLPDRPVSDGTWTDILALTGMATICDVVPLNGVNHKLAKQGVDALMRSRKPILVKLREAARVDSADEKDVGFKLGPRINAVGRLEHADLVIKAFIEEQPDELIAKMNGANEKRRQIQDGILLQARSQAKDVSEGSILFLGGDWHPGVVGIAASKIAEEHWKPTWLFQRKDGVCKGSARSLRGFDVTEAMASCKDLFTKFGGHAAAGGFTFPVEHEEMLRARLNEYATQAREASPTIWESQISYDCTLSERLIDLEVLKTLDHLKPFGHGFEEPRFLIRAPVSRVQFFNDKVTGVPKHTCIHIHVGKTTQKVLFFNEVISDIQPNEYYEFIVSFSRNVFRGVTQLSIQGFDCSAQRNEL